MIDTSKYEGHTPAEHWALSLWGFSMPTGFDADALLIADAPDLLAEVKRLREVIQRVVTILGPDEIEAEELLVDALKEMIEAGFEKEDDDE
jgi:hypothetical protein